MSETRSRYRKIEVRMWGDEKFRQMSPFPPCGQGLWLFLLTGPHTGPIPGLFRSGRAALAEDLDWDTEAFDKAFNEAFALGMVKADWKAKVVWIPKAIECNRPESPNVVTSWGSEWDLIPECDLKRDAYESLKASIHALGESFGKAFDKAFKKPSSKPCGKTCLNQEQEQEQEQNSSPPLPAAQKDDGTTPPAAEKSSSKGNKTFRVWYEQIRQAGEKPIPEGDPIFAYAEDAKLPEDYLRLAWVEFRDRYTHEEKRYKDWRMTFRKSVRENWFRLWQCKEGEGYSLTSKGQQAMQAFKARHGSEQQ